MGESNEQALANTAWACVKPDQAEEPPLAALARAANQRMGELHAQVLSNTTGGVRTRLMSKASC